MQTSSPQRCNRMVENSHGVWLIVTAAVSASAASNWLISLACVGVSAAGRYRGWPMTLPPPKVCELIRKLHAMLGSPSDQGVMTSFSRVRFQCRQGWVSPGPRRWVSPGLLPCTGSSQLVGDVGLDSHWPVELASRTGQSNELDLVAGRTGQSNLIWRSCSSTHLRAKGNEIQSN
jgi:hypothetical protein